MEEVKRGEIYIAADGALCGHLVIDVERYKYCDDVVTQPFTATEISNPDNRIDRFKLTVVRYCRCDDLPLPTWIPSEIVEMQARMWMGLL